MARLRLIVLLTRPAVALLLALFAAIGVQQSGTGQRYATLVLVLLSVLGFLLFSVAVNDLADEAIDRVNLPGDRRRPLVAGTASRRDMVAVAVAGLACSLGGAAALGIPVLVVTAGGIAISAGYSLRPTRLADRGAVAALVLPACYVAVPFLDGFFAAGGSIGVADLLLLAGLYLGFVGRILLKDFRDVRGDALFGKRTFLVRHGRARTCRISAVAWLLGTALVAVALGRGAVALDAVYAVAGAAVLWLLRGLGRDAHPRRDELRISALAILGRATLVALLAQQSMQHRGWPALGCAAVLVWLAAVTAIQARTMLRYGPRPQLTSAALRHIRAPEPDAVAIVAE